MGQSAITGINLGVPAFQLDFTNASLAAGVLTVTHNLNSQYVAVTVYNNSDLIIIPDDVTATSTTVCTIDLTSYGTLTGTWRAVIIDKGATVSGTGVATDLNLSGQAAEDVPIFDGVNWVAKGGNEKIKVDHFSQNLTGITTGVTTAVTGVGFKPSCVHFFAQVSPTYTTSWGFDDGTTRKSIWDASGSSGAGNYSISTTRSIWNEKTGSDWANGYIQSMDSDGFTIYWTKGGSPTGNCAIPFCAFR